MRTGASIGTCSMQRISGWPEGRSLPGPERHRSWCKEQKRAIVAAAFAPGAIVADVARRAAVCAVQIYPWRQDLRGAATGFPDLSLER
jgi:hypothetical protein